MRGFAAAIAFTVAACSGSQGAPRPIGPAPGLDERQSDEGTTLDVSNDDDGDNIDNEHDNCPLAREDWDDPVRDGCPDTGADAGVPPVPPLGQPGKPQ